MTAAPAPKQLTTAIQAVLPEALAAWVYGSAASGSMHAASDIDVAVLLPFSDVRRTAWLLKHEAQRLADIWGFPVDLVNFTTVSCVLQKEVLSAGRLLYSFDDFAVGVAELQALSQYRDFNERNACEFERIAQTGKVFA